MRGNQFQISGTFTAKALPFKNNNASCYLACEYSRLSFAPATKCETRRKTSSNERRLYSQATCYHHGGKLSTKKSHA